MLCTALLLTSGYTPLLAPRPAVAPGRTVARAARGPAMYGAMAKKPSAEELERGSFVQTEMRGAAMKLHTREQAPKEGVAPEVKAEQAPVKVWQPGKPDYLQFLVDSREVYACFEGIVASTDSLASFRANGLERTTALETDIETFLAEGIPRPDVASQGSEYVAFVRSLASEGRWEEFVCHYYNFYFAHTAGGRMIGKRMSDMLLEGRTLEFYTWYEAGAAVDPGASLLPKLRAQIDGMVEGWTRAQKDLCLAETANSFKLGGSMLQHISRRG